MKTWMALAFIGGVGIACQPLVEGLKDQKGEIEPYRDATKGEKPIPCTYGACGNWKIAQARMGNHGTSDFEMKLSSNQFSQKVVCAYSSGDYREAQVVVRAQVTPKEINIYQDETAKARGPGAQPDCVSKISRNRLAYQVQNDTLVLTTNDGSQSTWERE